MKNGFTTSHWRGKKKINKYNSHQAGTSCKQWLQLSRLAWTLLRRRFELQLDGILSDTAGKPPTSTTTSTTSTTSHLERDRRQSVHPSFFFFFFFLRPFPNT